MKHYFYLVAAAAVLFTGCTGSFKKSANGIEYKIISDGNGKKIAQGNFFEIAFDQTYKGPNKDTILFTSKDFSNQIVPLDSVSIPPVYYKIFNQVRKGDSLIISQLTDSVMKQQGPNGAPPFMKKGAHIIAHYKILNIYLTRESADSAYKVISLMARAKDSVKRIEQLKKDDKAITDYLTKNKIVTSKAPKGTYVEIINPGEGDAVDTSKVVKVFYTGKLMEDGKVFDSNTDPKFGHGEVYPVRMNAPEGSQYSVIKGWTDGLSLLKKGSKARLYIPSALAYGAQGSGADIKANANLIFDVELVDVITNAQAMAEAQVQRKMMEMQRQKAMDSMQKARKDTMVRK